MKVEMEKKYVAPEVEVLEVMVEKGFAGSGGGVTPPDIDDTPVDM